MRGVEKAVKESYEHTMTEPQRLHNEAGRDFYCIPFGIDERVRYR